jgi:hypothetical protein
MGGFWSGSDAERAGIGESMARTFAVAVLGVATVVCGPGASAQDGGETPDARVLWQEWIRARGSERTRLAREEGGGLNTERVVDRGLRWLSRHQGDDGRWSCDQFSAHCSGRECDGPGTTADYDIGVTGLALLAFVGAGEHPGTKQYGDVVQRGVDYLLSVQQEDGGIGPKAANGHWVYGHHIATQALAEICCAAGLDVPWRAKLEAAVGLTLAAQNIKLGWRYGVRPGDNDTSITSWGFMSMLAARHAGFTVPDAVLDGALAWFGKVTDTTVGKTGYTQRGDNGARLPAAQAYKTKEAMTGAALACRLLGGTGVTDPLVVKATQVLEKVPPVWEPGTGTDLYYWYYATIAMHQQGGLPWKNWSKALTTALVKSQRTRGHALGSWDPESAWGVVAGRVYATAMGVLCLESYYRYPRVRQE